jgi:hypothetical protein
VAPAVSPDGTLSYTPSGIAGTAVVEVVLQDSGGTEHGGKDKSEPHTLVIELTL